MKIAVDVVKASLLFRTIISFFRGEYMSSGKKHLSRLVLAAVFLALALTLPFITGQIPQIGNALCPMHIPVLLCGFFCGPVYGAVVGATAPLLRFLLVSMPPIMPTGIAMSFELATYGAVSAILYRYLPRRKPFIYVSLIGAMLSGRVVWGCVRAVLYGLGKSEFGVAAFIAGAFTGALPGIIIQIVLIPILVMVLEKVSRDPKRNNVNK